MSGHDRRARLQQEAEHGLLEAREPDVGPQLGPVDRLQRRQHRRSRSCQRQTTSRSRTSLANHSSKKSYFLKNMTNIRLNYNTCFANHRKRYNLT
jgi:hypothetical protein